MEVCYRDFGHLFGAVDADAEWEALLGERCGRSGAELAAEIGPITTTMKDALPLLPGVRELLDVAHGRGLKIGLGTGNSIENVRRRLGRLGVLDRFDAVVTRAEVAAGKPAPDTFLEVARRLAVPPARCLVLEDSVPGCQAAIAAGMTVIACPTVVTAHCEYPDGIEVVQTLLDVAL